MPTRAEQKAASHRRIVEAAATKLRQDGLDGMGVADVMNAAGLTHGGFYSHFRDKNALVEEAFAEAARFRESWVAGLNGDARDALAMLAARYLTRDHRDAPGDGCAFGPLAQAFATGEERHRRIFERELNATVETLSAFIDDGGDQPARDRALALISLCVGAMLLARAVESGPASEKLLSAARTFVAENGPPAKKAKKKARKGKKKSKKV